MYLMRLIYIDKWYLIFYSYALNIYCLTNSILSVNVSYHYPSKLSSNVSYLQDIQAQMKCFLLYASFSGPLISHISLQSVSVHSAS